MPPPRSRRGVGEITGEAAAECAAICCCCPCGLVGLIICVVVKLPAGLVRRALKNRRRRSYLKHKAGIANVKAEKIDIAEDWAIPSTATSPELLEMEKEMMERFYSTGFWRSPSQREER